MKTILTLTMAAAIATSAFAGELRTPAERITKPAAAKHENVMAHRPMATLDATSGVRRAPSAADLSGAWIFTFGDFYFKDSQQTYFAVDYTATVEGSTITFTEPNGVFFPIIGTVGTSGVDVTFQRTAAGQDGDYYVYMQPAVYNELTNQLEPVGELTAQYNDDYKLLVMPDNSAFIWEACIDADGTNPAGYSDAQDVLYATKFEQNPIMGGKWKNIGKASLADGWLTPAIGKNQFDNIYEVTMEQSEEDSNYYRLVNPYRVGPVKADNKTTNPGYILINIADPDHVVIGGTTAGFANVEMGITAFWCYNYLGALCANYPQLTPDNIVQQMTGYIPFSKYENGKITLQGGNFTNPSTGKENFISDANFGFQELPTGGQSWQTQSGQRLDMTTKIYFPGYDAVESIEADTNAPAEYFNLQGVRIANPQPGQVVIERRGSHTAKILTR